MSCTNNPHKLRALINSKARHRHPDHGHAFSRTSALSLPEPCQVCGETAWPSFPLITALVSKCLLCGTVAHRSCLGNRSSWGQSVGTCPEPADPSDECTTAETFEDDATSSVSIVDSGLAGRRAMRVTKLAGTTLLGSVVGGVVSGGVVTGAGLLIALGKAGCVVSGGTLGFLRERRKQIRLGVVLSPSVEGISPFWSERAAVVREAAIFRGLQSTSRDADQASQPLLDGCLLEERVNVFVSRVVLNPRTLPGALFRGLLSDFAQRHRRHGRHVAVAAQGGSAGGTAGDDSPPPMRSTPTSQEASAPLDALGLIHEVISAVFHFHPHLGADDLSAAETINAVDRLCFGEIYEAVFAHVSAGCRDEDEALRVRCGGCRAYPNEVAKTVGLSEEALRVLAAMGHASHTALDKMRAITRFVECVASSLPEPASADDLMPSLCLHVSAAAAAKVGPVSMHAEIEFVELFCRDDLLLLGREGYALASVKGAVSALGAMGTAAAAGGGGGE